MTIERDGLVMVCGSRAEKTKEGDLYAANISTSWAHDPALNATSPNPLHCFRCSPSLQWLSLFCFLWSTVVWDALQGKKRRICVQRNSSITSLRVTVFQYEIVRHQYGGYRVKTCSYKVSKSWDVMSSTVTTATNTVLCIGQLPKIHLKALITRK